jgi:prepilin-type processing-associated H-X9-DG protein/prepilin-type N-terminal cleavage/methylation domain-containing protein
MRTIFFRTRTGAFTLLELLVVISILGILAAFVLTGLSRGVGIARRVQCANNVRQLGNAMLQFVGDHHAFPLAVAPDVDGRFPGNCLPWAVVLERELGKNAVSEEMSFVQRGLWKCPAMRPPYLTDTVYVSYGYNDYGMYGGDRTGDTDSQGLGYKTGMSPGMTIASAKPVSESDVASPSEMMAIADGFWGAGKSLYGGVEQFTRTQEPLRYPLTSEPFSRHRGKANVVFCDGHVESPKLQFLFESTSDTALSCWNRDHRPHREKL